MNTDEVFFNSVVAVDGDRGIDNPIEYSLTSNGLNDISDIFRIQQETGIVFTTNNLDRESSLPGSSAYILQIMVPDFRFCNFTQVCVPPFHNQHVCLWKRTIHWIS